MADGRGRRLSRKGSEQSVYGERGEDDLLGGVHADIVEEAAGLRAQPTAAKPFLRKSNRSG